MSNNWTKLKRSTMKPTTAPKKRPAKRAVKTGSTEHKVMNLKNRINDAYHNPSKKVNTDDMRWVTQLLSDMRNNHWVTIPKEDMLKCNGLWRAYA